MRAINLAWSAVSIVALAALAACSPSAEAEGAPTAAEYRAAVESARTCVQRAGFETGSLQEVPHSKELQFSVEAKPGNEEAYDSCYDEHLKEISAAYLQPERLTGDERDRAMTQLIDCLERIGVSGLQDSTTDSRVFVAAIMDGSLSEDEVFEAMGCMETHRGVWPPGDANNP
ncbi:hypothetical protein FOJ82_00385 [Tessaracoccus rhinocerotis]|uniref:Lipoprotein n=1 Tax=Tessaracoccus rhinocerotis TaxID=1689449 RepID=A0A553K3X8_9ACTN|nr:hypothetical protein [Tessaracoccus rhinocerotis]TRY19410.1 hypothetical protein FOJ82_00385 [Tessaracoccus rhinocerotis]